MKARDMAPKGTQVVNCGTFEPRPQPCHSPLSPAQESPGDFPHKNKFKHIWLESNTFLSKASNFVQNAVQRYWLY